MEGIDKDLLEQSARRASRFLKTLSNESRMLVLCNLVDSEKTVSELEQILGIRQPTLSQQLARLRAEGFDTELVTGRRFRVADRVSAHVGDPPHRRAAPE